MTAPILLPGDLLRSIAKRSPNTTGVIFGDVSLTWLELNQRVNRLANALLGLGLVKGDKVAVLALNSHRTLETYLALAKSGLVAVPVNWQSTAPETAFILNDSASKALIVDSQHQAAATAALKDAPAVRHVVMLDGEAGAMGYEMLLAGASVEEPPVEVLADDLRALGYTSGTTGFPKGCISTHGQSMAALINFLVEIPTPREQATLLTVPFFTGYGNCQIHLALYTCSTIVIQAQFQPAQVFDAIQRYRIRHLFVVPTMIARMVNAPELRDYDLGSLQLMVYGGSVIAPEVLKTAMQSFGCGFCQVYGMSEAGGFVFLLTPEDHRHAIESGDERRLASCGRISQYAMLRLVDDDGVDVAQGEMGELLVACGSMTTGYWNNPELTAEAIRDGWLYTGDIAYQDNQGYVFIADRKKDMIVSGGLNIYPAEVEAAIAKHPAVAQVAVIGVPDAQWGESVKAVIELKQGASVTEDEIIDFCRLHLASQKKPKSVDFVAALPVSSSGKVSKKEIRDPYWQDQQRKV